MRRPDGVRTRPPFAAISSVRSHPWRSKGVSWPLLRSQLSALASEAVTVISRKLARPGQNLASLHADEGAADLRRRPQRLWKCAPAAFGPRVLLSSLWSHWKRSEPTPWPAPAINLHFGRGPKLRSRAIELEGGGGARRGAISAHERPRVPRSSAGLAGSRIRVYEMRITRPAELSPRRPWISAATGRLHYELTTDANL